MEVVRNIDVSYTIMKEPRGFLRAIQFVLSIFAFATLCTSATTHVMVKCGNADVDIPIKYSYPFNLHDITVKDPLCNGTADAYPFKNLSFAPAAQFFCFVGVISFLITLGLVVGYIVFSPVFVNESRGSVIDFIFSAIWTLMWFIASTAWADRLNVMGSYLGPDEIIKNDLKGLCGAGCTPGQSGDHATLVVSVLFGYLNMLVWGASLWFLFKETRWHKEAMGTSGETFDQPHAESGAGGSQGGAYQSAEPTSDAAPVY